VDRWPPRFYGESTTYGGPGRVSKWAKSSCQTHMRIASLKYRLQLPGFELPESVRLRHQAYDEHSARMLEEMADRIEHDASRPQDSVERSHELLNITVQGIPAAESGQLPSGRAQSFVAVLRAIDGLTTSLASDIAAEFGRPPAPSQLGPG
jgi:hypothetical protein